MKFWKRLRWISTLLFVALLLASWLGSGPSTPSPGASPGRQNVPTFHP